MISNVNQIDCEQSVRSRLFAYGSVIAAGTVMMALEVLGTRYIGPFFGSSLYVWSAMISVTLGSLALGYILGGWCCGRWRAHRVLTPVLGLTALWAGLLTPISRPVLLAASGLGLKAGILVSAAVLFGPPLILLGAISPLAVQALARPGQAGRAAGVVAALSTVSGVVSTLVTAMILLPRFPVDLITAGVAVGLLMWCVLVSFARHRAVLGGSLVVLALVVVPVALTYEAPRSAEATLIDQQYGHVGMVRVLDTSAFRFLMIDTGGQSVVWRQSGASDLAYTDIVARLGALSSRTGRVLLVGLGGGLIVRDLDRSGIMCDVVEIEPAVVEMATRHFGFEPTGDVFIEDARTFLNRHESVYDAVILDVFGGGTSPAHLFTVESMQAVRNRLGEGGLLVLNYPYAVEETLEIPRRISATLSTVFEHVALYEIGPDEIRNLIFVASDRAIPTIASYTQSPLPSTDQGFAVTDRFNPLDRLQIRQAEAFREWYVEVLGAEALLP